MLDDVRDKRLDAARTEDDEPAFVPPEVIAHDEEIVVDMNEPDEPDADKPAKDKPPKDKKKPGRIKIWLGDLKYWWRQRSKKQKFMIGGAALGVLIMIGAGLFFMLHKPKPVPKQTPVVKKEEVKEPPKPTTEASKLTGLQVSPEFNKLPVTGVMIENSPDARPQAGLKDAGVIFEAVAEGGITRFLALYQEAQPDYVGPVRSVRPYYLSWLQGFDAAIAHVGGSPDGLAKIRSDSVKDLDQFYNGGAYQRVSQRYAPHNVYTSLGNLIALQNSKGFSSTFTGFPRKSEKAAATPTAKAINFAISAPLYNVHYDYVAATNTYNRVEGGQPHTDDKSGQQLSPKVVVAIVVPQGIAGDGLHTTYTTVGSGHVYVFQDGTVTEGTWSKASDKAQIEFKDVNGAPIALNAGQTWISVVGAAGDVSYTP